MPQVADAEGFLRGLGALREGVTISGLVPNDRALDRAITMREEGLLDTIFLVFAESKATLAANGMTSSHGDLLTQIDRASARAKEVGLTTSVFVSTAYGCSIEGRIDPAEVIGHVAELRAMAGVAEVIVSDSTGQADPLQVLSLLTGLAEQVPTDERLGVHFHDTRGAGLANLLAALMSPFEHLVIDAAFGGWGGDWPFVPEAFGNVATEDVVEMLFGMGIDVGVDVAKVMAVTTAYAELSGRPIGAKLVDAQPIEWKRQAKAGV
jgi:isopropylmalate/homocitrate/citramalate synthase